MTVTSSCSEPLNNDIINLIRLTTHSESDDICWFVPLTLFHASANDATIFRILSCPVSFVAVSLNMISTASNSVTGISVLIYDNCDS